MSPRRGRATLAATAPQAGTLAALAVGSTLACTCALPANAADGANPGISSEPNARASVMRAAKTSPAAVAEPAAEASLWGAVGSTLSRFVGPFEVVEASDKWARDISLQLGMTEGGRLDLMLTIPQQQTVSVRVPGTSTLRLGTFTHLPPTLFTQWHFNPDGRLKPYVGAGFNLSGAMKQQLVVDDGAGGVRQLELDSAIASPAIQAGLDFAIDTRWSAGFDVRKIWIDSNVVTDAHSKVGAAVIDPAQYSLRMNYRF